MKAKKIYKALLKNIPTRIGEMEIDDYRREMISVIQIQAVVPLLGNKKKNKKWLSKKMLNSGFNFNL